MAGCMSRVLQFVLACWRVGPGSQRVPGLVSAFLVDKVRSQNLCLQPSGESAPETDGCSVWGVPKVVSACSWGGWGWTTGWMAEGAKVSQSWCYIAGGPGQGPDSHKATITLLVFGLVPHMAGCGTMVVLGLMSACQWDWGPGEPRADAQPLVDGSVSQVLWLLGFRVSELVLTHWQEGLRPRAPGGFNQHLLPQLKFTLFVVLMKWKNVLTYIKINKIIQISYKHANLFSFLK